MKSPAALFATALFVAALFAAALFAAAPALAADGDGLFAVKGLGRVTCKDFVAEHKAKSPAFAAMVGWLDGYVTAANRYAGDTYDMTSFESTDLLIALIEQHCQRHPDHVYAAVAQALLGRLENQRIVRNSPALTVPGAQRDYVLYVETVRRLQGRLKDRGLYKGAIDGLYGPGTRAAVKAFQEAAGVTATGEPDQLTLLRLFHGGG